MPSILVIDDEEDIRELVRATLKIAGHDVLTAPNGAAGLELLRAAHAHPVDLVITDLLMPDKEGLETIAELKAAFPAIKIIAMTGGNRKIRHTDGLLYTAEQVGANAILMKPFSAKDLHAKVADALTTARSIP